MARHDLLIRTNRRVVALIRILVVAAITVGLTSGLSLALPAPAYAEPTPTPTPTDKVTVGFFINDLQDLDLASDSYTVDFYMWMRWRNPKIDPSITIETMNSNAWQNTTSSSTGGVTGRRLYDAPRDMPDGSKYMIMRYQGVFSRRLNLEKFPFDTQNLALIFEDGVEDLTQLEYVPDTKPVVIGKSVTLPGYIIGQPTLRIVAHEYATDFGDLTAPANQKYSRIIVAIPLKRDVLPYLFKIVLPIFIVILITSLIYLLPARLEEARAGIGITAMLTIVALQWTTDSSLPSVDYLMMLDLVYVLSLFYIFIAMGYTVLASRRNRHEVSEAVSKSLDRRAGIISLAVYVAAIGLTLVLYLLHHQVDTLG